ncbi:hypothetical protein BKA64DRAFT_120415 [Cadophora sp. MPI-SDFR-AT-0126]|nr:hypothetical protein BKA64DRAFT_120415 [Leotiomycetes sp. MPI-SDFR-AT-0126]
MKKDINTNIMLDLECTGILPNPCILQIGAVYFDLDTGEEYSHFCTPVSLKSCEDVNLQSTEATMEWLLKHSPQVLEESKKSEVTIFQALFRFNNFLRKAERANRYRLEEMGRLYASDISELVVWGNGAVADNTWINSAYAACDLLDRKPWTYKNDMCVRTLVRTAGDILGRNFAREERFQGTRHDALDDCRHQVRYMVKARNAMKALSERPKVVSSLVMTYPVREAKDADLDDVSKESGMLESIIPPSHLPIGQQVLIGLEVEKVLDDVSHKPNSFRDYGKSPEGIPRPQEVGPGTNFQLSSSPGAISSLQEGSPMAVHNEGDAELDALGQAAFETYEAKRPPRTSQTVAEVLPTQNRNSLRSNGEISDAKDCGEQPREALAVDVVQQLEKLKVS